MSRNDRVRVAVYSRVSTDEQVNKGISLGQQPEMVEKMLRDKFGPDGYEVVLSVEDPGLTGGFGPSVHDYKIATRSKKFRPGLKQILEAIETREIDCVAAYDLGRIYREAAFQLAFFTFVQKHGVRLVTVADNIDLDSASGVLSAHMMAVIAEFQRKQNNERIKANLDVRREKGLWQGTAPFGWRFSNEEERQAGVPRTIVPIEAELVVVRRIGELFLRGASEKKIADQLNSEGILHRLKKKDANLRHIELPWDWQSISNILKCCAHAGLVNMPNGKTRKGLHFDNRAYEPEVFERVGAALVGRRGQLRGVPKDRSDNLLTNLVTCATCGQGLQFVKSEGSEAYVCRGVRGRGDYHVYVPADLLLPAVLHEMRQLTTLPDLLRQGETQIKAMFAAEFSSDRLRQLNQQRARLDRQMDEALRQLREGLLDEPLFAKQRDEIRASLAPLISQIESQESARDSARANESRFRQALKALANFDEAWQGLVPAEKRELLRLSIESATVKDLTTHTELRIKLGPFREKAVVLPKRRAPNGLKEGGIKGLTERELAALWYAHKGVKPVEAAARMGVGASTYSTLTKRAMERVGASTVKAAAKKAEPWIRRVEHLLPLGPGKPCRRKPRNAITLAERVVGEMHRDGLTGAEIAKDMNLDKRDVEAMLERANKENVAGTGAGGSEPRRKT